MLRYQTYTVFPTGVGVNRRLAVIERALRVRGPRRRHIAADADGMINPVPIGATGLWLEANQSATSAQRVAELILEAFGYSGGDFYVAML